MKATRITFGVPKEVTNPDEDSRSFLYPFSFVDSDLVGTPEEARVTAEHRLIVTAANNRLPAWRLSEPDLVKVLFEIGRRTLEGVVKNGTLKRTLSVTVSTETHSSVCPFDPSRIKSPQGSVMAVPEESRIGFR
jgi:hypothetical protein